MDLQKLPALALRNPRATILIASLLSLSALPGLFLLQLRVDGRSLVPRDAPEVAYDRRVRDLFDLDDVVAVVIETDHPHGIFNERTLNALVDLTKALRGVAGVNADSVLSLATESNGRVRPGTLEFRDFLDPLPDNPEEMARLRQDLARLEILHGTLISSESSPSQEDWRPRATAILAGVEGDGDRNEIHAAIQDLVASRAPGQTIHVVGAPVAEALMGRRILEDLARLIPFSVLVMAVIFYVSFGSGMAVLVPLIEVAACLVFVFGVMGYVGVPVFLTTAILPMILTAIGVADEIHVFSRYLGRLREREPGTHHHATLVATMGEMTRPVVRTSLTTAIAFLSFTISPVASVRFFGGFAALGILFCLLWTLTVVPASLVLLAPDRCFRRFLGRPQSGAASLRRLVRWVLGRPGVVVGVVAFLLLMAPLGIARLEVQDSWLDGFSRNSDFYRSTQRTNELFHGTHLLQVHVDARPGVITGELEPDPDSDPLGPPAYYTLSMEAPSELDATQLIGQRRVVRGSPRIEVDGQGGPDRQAIEYLLAAEITELHRDGDRLRLHWRFVEDPARRISIAHGFRGWRLELTGERFLEPRLLEELGRFEDFLGRQTGDEVGGVLGPHGELSALNFMVFNYQPESLATGAYPSANQQIIDFYARVRGQHRLGQLLDESRRQSRVTVFLEDANYVATRRLLDKIRRYGDEHFAPLGVALGFAGDVAVSQAMIAAVVRTQMQSLLLSLVGVFLLATILGRSIRWGIYCVLPASLAVLVVLAAMGYFRMPLGVATSMFSGIVIGVGVDYAIHLLECWRRSAASGLTGPGLIEDTFARAGPAIRIDAIAVAAGFAVLLGSQIPANYRLAALVITSIATCCLCTLTVFPLLLSRWAPSQRSDP